jgi:hypothetical protein
MYQRSNTSHDKTMTGVEMGCSRGDGVSEADVFAKILQQMLGYLTSAHQFRVIQCGSGLARESGVSGDININCAAVFAGKPAPTGI